MQAVARPSSMQKLCKAAKLNALTFVARFQAHKQHGSEGSRHHKSSHVTFLTGKHTASIVHEVSRKWDGGDSLFKWKEGTSNTQFWLQAQEARDQEGSL